MLDPSDGIIWNTAAFTELDVVYARYLDDLVVFDVSMSRLREMRKAIRRQLWDLRLDLHPGKSGIYRVADGVTFLGWRIFPGHVRLVRP